MDFAVTGLNELGRWLVVQLGRMSVELAILAGLVAIALYILRVKSPALRHLFWGLLLAKPVVTLLVASPLSLYAFLWPPIPEVFYVPAPVAAAMNPISYAHGVSVPDVSPPTVQRQPAAVARLWGRIDRYGLTAAIWMLVASVLGLRLLLGCVYVAFLRSTALVQHDGPLAELVAEVARPFHLWRRVQIATTQVAHGPVLAGILRPVILLPATMAAALTPTQLRLVITHELAHARRWDNLVLFIQRLAETLFFFHPVVWFCGWMMRREAEAACDDMVIRAYGDADDAGATAYAESLTRVAEMKCGITQRLLVNTFAAAESNFARRIRRIRSVRRTRMTVRFSIAIGAVLVVIGAFGLPTVLSEREPYWIQFDDSCTAGLREGDIVEYLGVPVGEVKAIRASESYETRVQVLINPRKVTLREGVEAQLVLRDPATGSMAVRLTGGDPNGVALAPTCTLPTKPAQSVDEWFPVEDGGQGNASQEPKRGRSSGIVRSATTGKPVVGAYVGVGYFGDAGGSNHEIHRKKGLYAGTKTDDQGRYTLDGLALGVSHREFVTHPDYARRDGRFTLSESEPSRSGEFHLTPAAKVDVTAVDSAGAPAPGQYLFRLKDVEGNRHIPPGVDPHLSSLASTVWTEGPRDGAFSFSQLDEGVYAVDVIRLALAPQQPPPGCGLVLDDRSTVYYGVTGMVDVVSGQTVDLHVSPQEHGTRLVCNMALNDGYPMEFPRICAIGRCSELPFEAQMKTRGLEDPKLGHLAERALVCTSVLSNSFTVANLPPGEYTILAGPILELAGVRVQLSSGQEKQVTFPSAIGKKSFADSSLSSQAASMTGSAGASS